MFGGVPLAWARIGSNCSPLGIAIVGGLIFSQLLTLFTTPVVYLAFDSIATRLNAFWARHSADHEGQLALPPKPGAGTNISRPSSSGPVAHHYDHRYRPDRRRVARFFAGFPAAADGFTHYQRRAASSSGVKSDDGLCQAFNAAGAASLVASPAPGNDLFQFAGVHEHLAGV